MTRYLSQNHKDSLQNKKMQTNHSNASALPLISTPQARIAQLQKDYGNQAVTKMIAARLSSHTGAAIQKREHVVQRQKDPDDQKKNSPQKDSPTSESTGAVRDENPFVGVPETFNEDMLGPNNPFSHFFKGMYHGVTELPKRLQEPNAYHRLREESANMPEPQRSMTNEKVTEMENSYHGQLGEDAVRKSIGIGLSRFMSPFLGIPVGIALTNNHLNRSAHETMDDIEETEKSFTPEGFFPKMLEPTEKNGSGSFSGGLMSGPSAIGKDLTYMFSPPFNRAGRLYDRGKQKFEQPEQERLDAELERGRNEHLPHYLGEQVTNLGISSLVANGVGHVLKKRPMGGGIRGKLLSTLAGTVASVGLEHVTSNHYKNQGIDVSKRIMKGQYMYNRRDQEE